MRNPWLRYLKNKLSILISLFGISAIMAAVIPVLNISAGAEIAALLFGGIAAVSLSGFILVGLQGIKMEAKGLFSEIETLDADKTKGIHARLGSTNTALRLATTGQVVSMFAGIANTTATVTTALGAKITGDQDRWLAKEWVIVSLVAINMANWSGFVLFNVLGFRNAQLTQEKIKLLPRQGTLSDHKEEEVLATDSGHSPSSSQLPSPAGVGFTSISSPKSTSATQTPAADELLAATPTLAKK